MVVNHETLLSPQLPAHQWEVVLMALRKSGPWEAINPVITALSQQLDAEAAMHDDALHPPIGPALASTSPSPPPPSGDTPPAQDPAP